MHSANSWDGEQKSLGVLKAKFKSAGISKSARKESNFYPFVVQSMIHAALVILLNANHVVSTQEPHQIL